MEAADRHAFSVEAALIFCGDVVLRQVGVEVEGDVLQPPAAFAEFLQRPLEKFAALGLEMDAAVFWEDVVVDLEKTMVGEPTLGVAVFRPGIGEMQIDLADLARREDLVEMLGVQPEQTHLLWRALLFGVVVDGVVTFCAAKAGNPV